MDTDREAWARQQGESAKAHLAFLIFRDLGPTRSYPLVAQRLTVSTTLVKRWAGRWEWQLRAMAWDEQQRRLDDQARREVTEDATRNHLGASRAFLATALRAISGPPGKDDYMPSASMLASATTAMDKAIHHHRLALGLPTDVTRQDITLRENQQELARVVDGVRRVIEEHLCDECRARIAGELRRLGEHHRTIAARLEA